MHVPKQASLCFLVAGAQQPELASSSDDASIDQFFENLKDPSMRESLYQYLPENMRKPETLDMLMSNPMVRDQFRSASYADLICADRNG